MIRQSIKVCLSLVIVVVTFYADPACYPWESVRSPELDTGVCNAVVGDAHILDKTVYWNIYWPSSTVPHTKDPYGRGECFYRQADNQVIYCWPGFNTPVHADRSWSQSIDNQIHIGNACELFYSTPYSDSPLTGDCPCSPNPPQPPCQNGYWQGAPSCRWAGCDGSPIIIDLDNDGYKLTNAADGVHFDLRGTGEIGQWSWTARGSDDAFLALDRNGDGQINNGKELFGNFTDQPMSAGPNGFVALAMFDENHDGWIDKYDSVYRRLLLWVDSNHDGISQPGELHSLDWGGVDGISLDYRMSKRTDQYGNNFRYRGAVRGRDVSRWAWDVFLIPGWD